MAEGTCYPKKVEALIVNEGSSYTEDDREFLGTWNDDQLDKALAMIPAKEEEPTTPAATVNGASEEGTEEVTVDAFLENAPESVKTVLLEGLALEYLLGNIYIRPFLSWNSYDCTAGESTYYKYKDNDNDGVPNDEDEDDFTGIGPSFPTTYSCKNSIFSSICEEPDYEIESDRAKRNNLSEYLFGINLSSHLDQVKVGGTLTYAFFNRLIDPYYNFDPGEGDKTGYSFRGMDYLSSSIYFKVYEPFEIFGEIVGSYNQKLS